MCSLIGLHRVQDEKLVHLLGELWVIVADSNPVGITLDDARLSKNGFIDFNIEAVVLTQSSGEKDINHRLRFCLLF